MQELNCRRHNLTFARMAFIEETRFQQIQFWMQIMQAFRPREAAVVAAQCLPWKRREEDRNRGEEVAGWLRGGEGIEMETRKTKAL